MMENYFSQVINLSATGLIIMVILMLVLWLVHIPMKNAGIVDIGWGGGLVLLAVLYYFLGSGYEPRKILITLMVIVWGSRLTLHLFYRTINDDKEDGRYVQIRKDWKKNILLKFFFFFQFQGILNIILAVPFLLIALNPFQDFVFTDWTGFAVWFIGVAGELISDEQLRSFKNDANNKGRVCNTGLWKYSRHPNYFFEFLIWVGYAVTALSSPYGYLAFISPAIILYLLLRVTGIPATEAQAIRSKGDAYRNYQKQTSKFLPMKPRILNNEY